MKRILMLTIDGLHPARLGSGGQAPSPSPVLDELFARGLTFTRAFAVGCPTQFAMPGLFVSQLALDEGGYERGIVGRGVSFVEVLHSAGYRTVGFTTADAAGRLYGYDRGFDEFYSLFRIHDLIRDVYTRRKKHYGPSYRAGLLSLDHCLAQISPLLSAMFENLRLLCAEKDAEIASGSLRLSPSIHNWDFSRMHAVLTEEAARFHADPRAYVQAMLTDDEPAPFVLEIEGLRTERVGPDQVASSARALGAFGIEAPAFDRAASARCVVDNVLRRLSQADDHPLFLWAHFLDCHEFNATSYDVGTAEEVEAEARAAADFQAKLDEGRSFVGHPPYFLAIQYVDAQIGRIVDHLERAGMLDETLIVLTSDHGWPIGHPPRVTLDITDFYDELYQVPLCFVGPNLASGRVDGIASVLDVGPTILALAGLAPPVEMRGEVIHRPDWTGRDFVYWEHLGRGPCDFATKPMSVCVRSEEYKVICRVPPLGQGGEGEMTGFYDLSLDPTEQRNLVDDGWFPDELAWMIEVIEERGSELEGWFLGHDDACAEPSG